MKDGKWSMVGMILFCLAIILNPHTCFAGEYPERPITIYCGYEVGATTDLTARALAAEVEKILGVPVVVENKAGGGSTVAASLVASKKPDGYTFGIVHNYALSVRPHAIPLSYNPLKDFTFICEYSVYPHGLCVLSESPLKTIDEFIAYAKKHPGLSYGTPGPLSQGQLALEQFAKCKGLTFKHVPFKGGAPANTALLGKHIDFIAGSGSHIPYLKQGKFRMLCLLNTDKRDPNYPDIPTLKDLGCQDAPGGRLMVIAPKGMKEEIYKKVLAAFEKATQQPKYQKVLDYLEMPNAFKTKEKIDKEIPAEYAWFKNFLIQIGMTKK